MQRLVHLYTQKSHKNTKVEAIIDMQRTICNTEKKERTGMERKRTTGKVEGRRERRKSKRKGKGAPDMRISDKEHPKMLLNLFSVDHLLIYYCQACA